MTKLTDNEISLAEHYHDGATTDMLLSFIDDQVELNRLNLHRNEDRQMQSLNRILVHAIRMRTGRLANELTEAPQMRTPRIIAENNWPTDPNPWVPKFYGIDLSKPYDGKSRCDVCRGYLTRGESETFYWVAPHQRCGRCLTKRGRAWRWMLRWFRK